MRVKGAPSTTTMSTVTDLGLSVDQITVTPHYNHREVLTDDYGPNVPANVLTNMCDASIDMTLVYWDPAVLSECLAQSLGGGVEGTMVTAGTPLGVGIAPPGGSANNSWISLNLISSLPVSGGTAPFNYHFPTTYLAGTPEVVPVGTKRSEVRLHWRAIPYGFPNGATSRKLVYVIDSRVLVEANFQELIDDDQFFALVAELKEFGFVMAPIGPAVTSWEVRSQGAVVWDFTPDT